MPTILAVDDDKDFRDAICAVLEPAGHRVVTASNPSEAQLAIEQHKPALLILDVMMQAPDDGIAMAQRLRRQGNTIPIVMLTSLPRVAGLGFGKDSEGDCSRPGVYEVPFGATVASVLELVGANDARAVQIGGASGICVPSSEFGRAIAFEDVATGGSLIVFGRGRDMLDVARSFLEFFVEESCGQCTPCREGSQKLLDGVERLARGSCSTAYLDELCALGETLQLASKCGLGQSAPNAFLSIVQHFRDELMGRGRVRQTTRIEPEEQL